MPYQPRTETYRRGPSGKIIRLDGVHYDDRDLGVFRPALEIYKGGGAYQATLLDVDGDQVFGRTLENAAALGETRADAVRVLEIGRASCRERV